MSRNHSSKFSAEMSVIPGGRLPLILAWSRNQLLTLQAREGKHGGKQSG